ncbi:MAG: hypothetical protein ABSE49_11120 [Polyangiaceae bacterium]
MQHVTAAIILGGTSATQAALTAIYQAAIQAQSDLDAARSVVNAKLQAQKAALAVAESTTALLHSWAVASATRKAKKAALATVGEPTATPAATPAAAPAKA